MMDHRRQYLLGVVLAVALTALGRAASPDQVRSRRERCVRRLERVERRLHDLEITVDRIERLDTGENEETRRFLETARDRIDYFRGRLDRVRNQDRRIADDLRRLGSGDACPDCLASEVRLMCRQVENLAAELGDYHAEVGRQEPALRRRAGTAEVIERTARMLASACPDSGGNTDPCARAAALLDSARAERDAGNEDTAMDRALKAGDLLAPLLPAGGPRSSLEQRLDRLGKRADGIRGRIEPDKDRAAATLLDKASAHLREARTLGAREASKRALIAEKLLEKAEARASGSR